MSEIVYIYENYDNTEVLHTYLDIIATGLTESGFKCIYTQKISEIDKHEWILFPVSKDAFKYYMKGYHNIIQWQQGIAAEESYMRHKSIVRFKVLHFIDRFVLDKAKLVFFVSDTMKRYYQDLYKKDYSNKSFVMPCFNEKFNIQAAKNKDYNKHSFAYVGSLAEWQCFEETIDLYKIIESAFEDAYLLVLTFEKEKAERILKEKNIIRYTVKTVPKEEVNHELENITYGFVLREDNLVNRVATPTKISSYLSAGVLPIFSSCIEDFNFISKLNNIGCSTQLKGSSETIIDYIKKEKESTKVINGIEAIFNTYYNDKLYIDSMVEKIGLTLQ